MKKQFVRFISLALLTVLIISMALSGCGNKTGSSNTPVTPPAQDGQGASAYTEAPDESSTPTAPVSPDSKPVAPPDASTDASTEDVGFVKDGKVYIIDCIYVTQRGEINGSGRTAWEGKYKAVAEELIKYRSSDDVKEYNIEGALLYAFKPVITSHVDESGDCQIENLKNGDIVTWTYEINEEKLERLKSYVTGIEFVVTDGELVIEGLS